MPVRLSMGRDKEGRPSERESSVVRSDCVRCQGLSSVVRQAAELKVREELAKKPLRGHQRVQSYNLGQQLVRVCCSQLSGVARRCGRK